MTRRLFHANEGVRAGLFGNHRQRWNQPKMRFATWAVFFVVYICFGNVECSHFRGSYITWIVNQTDYGFYPANQYAQIAKVKLFVFSTFYKLLPTKICLVKVDWSLSLFLKSWANIAALSPMGWIPFIWITICWMGNFLVSGIVNAIATQQWALSKLKHAVSEVFFFGSKYGKKAFNDWFRFSNDEFDSVYYLKS